MFPSQKTNLGLPHAPAGTLDWLKMTSWVFSIFFDEQPLLAFVLMDPSVCWQGPPPSLDFFEAYACLTAPLCPYFPGCRSSLVVEKSPTMVTPENPHRPPPPHCWQGHR